MTTIAKFELVLLHESEIRTASAALEKFFNLPEGHTDDEYQSAAKAALQASYAALHHPGIAEGRPLIMFADRIIRDASPKHV